MLYKYQSYILASTLVFLILAFGFLCFFDRYRMSILLELDQQVRVCETEMQEILDTDTHLDKSIFNRVETEYLILLEKSKKLKYPFLFYTRKELEELYYLDMINVNEMYGEMLNIKANNYKYIQE